VCWPLLGVSMPTPGKEKKKVFRKPARQFIVWHLRRISERLHGNGPPVLVAVVARDKGRSQGQVRYRCRHGEQTKERVDITGKHLVSSGVNNSYGLREPASFFF